MFEVAADLKMREEWVELRHQVTHGGELPGLKPLELAVDGALSWLWDTFWSRFSDEDEQEAAKVLKRRRAQSDNDEATSLKSDIRGILKQYVSARKTELTGKSMNLGLANSLATENTSSKLVDLYSRYSESLPALMSLFVREREMIVPSNRSLKETMAGAFTLWDPILLRLSITIRPFLVTFVRDMVEKITAPATVDESQDPIREAFMLWTKHVLASDEWAARRTRSKDGTRELRRHVLVECVLNPGSWTNGLSQCLSAIAAKESPQGWDAIHKAGRIRALQEEGETSTDLAAAVAKQNSAYGSGSTKSSFVSGDYGGWRQWPGKWRATPIGVVEDEEDF